MGEDLMKLPALRGSSRGMTLVEVLVVLVVVGLVSSAVIALLLGGLDGWARGTSKAYAETSASIGAQKLSQEIRDAQSASVSAGPPATLTVVFPQESVDGSGETCYSRGVIGQTREYYVPTGSTTLKRRISGVESVVLERVSGAAFAVSGANVTVTITGMEQVSTSVANKQSTARVRLRNFKT